MELVTRFLHSLARTFCSDLEHHHRSKVMQATGRLILGRGVLHKALTRYQQDHFRLQSVSPSLSCRSVSSGSPTPIVNPASRPYARHRPTLPKPKSYKLPGALLVLFSVATWSAFTLHATNRERLSSSVLKNVLDRIETSPQVQRAMGDDVSLKKETFLAGDAWIRGSVSN